MVTQNKMSQIMTFLSKVDIVIQKKKTNEMVGSEKE